MMMMMMSYEVVGSSVPQLRAIQAFFGNNFLIKNFKILPSTKKNYIYIGGGKKERGIYSPVQGGSNKKFLILFQPKEEGKLPTTSKTTTITIT